MGRDGGVRFFNLFDNDLTVAAAAAEVPAEAADDDGVAMGWPLASTA